MTGTIKHERLSEIIDIHCRLYQFYVYWLTYGSMWDRQGHNIFSSQNGIIHLRPSDRPTSDIYIIQQIWVISSEKSFGRFSKKDEKRDASRVNIEGELNLHKDWRLANVKTEDFLDTKDIENKEH